MRDYRWVSPASLYTFQETFSLLGLARDCLYLRAELKSLKKTKESFPEFTQFIHDSLLYRAPKISGLRSTTELPRHDNTTIVANRVAN